MRLHDYFGRTCPWQTLGSDNFLSFVANAVKLWETVRLSLGINSMKFDFTGGKYFIDIGV